MTTARDRWPNAKPVEWTDETGTFRALELPDGARVAVECVSRVLTPAEEAEQATEAATRTNDGNRRQTLRNIRDKIKAGTDTAADRSRAIKILIGLALADKPEANE